MAQSIENYLKTDLKNLFSPLVKLILEIVKLCFTVTSSLPFVLKLLEILNNLSGKTGFYIPTSTFCIEILNMHEFEKKAKEPEEALPEFDLLIKIPKRSNQSQKLVTNQALNIIIQFCAINSKCVFFPEIAFPLIFYLNKLKSSALVFILGNSIRTMR